MGEVAAHAGCHGVVGYRIDLGETGGSGGVEGVADGAELPLPINGGLHLHWSGHMVRSCPMTDFAGHSIMVGGRPNGLDVSMAEGALLAPGVHLMLLAD